MSVLFGCEILCTNHLGIHSGQWESFVDWQLWQVWWWMSDCSLVFVVIPVKMGLSALGIDDSAIIIVKFICQVCYTRYIRCWLREIKNILDVNRMLLSTVIFLAPSSCAHACCAIFSTTNRRNVVLISPVRQTDEYVLVIVYVNVCTIVTYYRRWIGVKFDWLILNSLVNIQDGRMCMVGFFYFTCQTRFDFSVITIYIHLKRTMRHIKYPIPIKLSNSISITWNADEMNVQNAL